MGLAVFNTAARIAMREADWVYPYSCRQRWNATAGRMEVLRCPASIGSDRSFSPNSLPYSIAIALLSSGEGSIAYAEASLLFFSNFSILLSSIQFPPSASQMPNPYFLYALLVALSLHQNCDWVRISAAGDNMGIHNNSSSKVSYR